MKPIWPAVALMAAQHIGMAAGGPPGMAMGEPLDEDKVLFELLGRDLLSTAIYMVCAGLAVCAGVGGGGIFVPLLVLINEFSPHGATGVSQAMVCGASLAGFAMNVRQRHPKIPSRPLVDLPLVLTLAPLQICGTLLGVIVNKVLPSIAILGVMIIVLGYTSERTLTKGLQTYRKERSAEEAPTDALDVEETAEPPRYDALVAKVRNGTQRDELQDDGEGSVSSDGHVREEENSYVGFLFVWLFVLAFVILKGSRHSPSVIGIKPCTTMWWLIQVGGFISLLWLSAWYGREFLRAAALRVPVEGEDLRWSQWAVGRLLALSFVAGVVSGCIGIGGGMIMGPILLQMGMTPQVSAAVTLPIVLMTSSSAALTFVVSGLIPIPYALFFSCVCFFGAATGKTVVDGYIRRHNCQSLVIFVLVGILFSTVGFIVITGIRQFTETTVTLTLQSPC